MTGWLVDTNVVAELRKPGCDAQVRDWARSKQPRELFLSRITIAEIRFGIERTADPQFRVELESWLSGVLKPWFGDRILDIDEEVILEWRRLVARGRSQNRTFPQPDLFLAATARVRGLVVVTWNVRDFDGTDTETLNPWHAT